MDWIYLAVAGVTGLVGAAGTVYMLKGRVEGLFKQCDSLQRRLETLDRRIDEVHRRIDDITRS